MYEAIMQKRWIRESTWTVTNLSLENSGSLFNKIAQRFALEEGYSTTSPDMTGTHSSGSSAVVVQSLSQRSKTRTSVADPGSASGGTFQCMQFLPFLSIFSYLFYLGHLSLLGLQTKTRRQSNSSTLCSFKSHNPETFMSSTASASVHAICKRSQKCLTQKVGHLGSLGWIPMIQGTIQ